MQILIIIALVIIGILLFELIIFSHEFGHFITAKKSGVKVNEFSLGMGPKILGFKKGETDYSLRLLPLGGFCAMEGEDEESPEPRAFNNAKIWKRMIIIIAGAVMNIILGFIMMFAYTVQADNYASTTVNGFYPNSVSANCGLKVGDQITEINGYSVWNSRDLQFAMATMTCREVDGTTLEIYRQDCARAACNAYNSILNDNEDIDDSTNSKLYEILTDGCTNINSAASKEAAYSIYKQTGEDIFAEYYKGKKSFEPENIEEEDTRLRYTSDLKVIRDGEEVELKDVQFFTYYQSKEDEQEGKTSLSFDFVVTQIDKTFGSVISQTVSNTCSVAKMVWTSLVWLVQGRFSFTDLSGPVGIATAVTQVASIGLETSFLSAFNNILFVMIMITINLGIFNMLPFPALDGGRFLFLLIEGIFRKPIPRKVEQVVNSVGFALLMVFMVVITFKDIWQLITGTMPGM